MSRKGGPLANLVFLSYNKIQIELAQTTPLAKKALIELQGFILVYSPLLSISSQRLKQLGIFVVALVVKTLILNKLPIGLVNVIRLELAITYSTISLKPTPISALAISSTSTCPNLLKTLVRSNPLLCCQQYLLTINFCQQLLCRQN